MPIFGDRERLGWDHPNRLIRTRARWHDTGKFWRYRVLEFIMGWLGYDDLYDSRHQ